MFSFHAPFTCNRATFPARSPAWQTFGGRFMIRGQLIHPQIMGALARSGHGSKILISDGNYPHWTKRGHNAEVVYLNLTPGILQVTDVLKVLVHQIPIESA